MKKIIFNDNWMYAPQSDEFLGTPTVPFQPVTLPHDAMIHEKRVKQLPGGRNTGYYPYGSYEYKKTFCLLPEWRGKKIQLLFEGVYAAAMVYVNQMFAGSCMNGYTPFTVDVNPFLREGENEIKVICRAYRDSRWYSGAGIYRDVCLLISNHVYLPYGKSSIVTKEICGSEAVLEANVCVKNETADTQTETVRIELFDEQRKSAGCAVRKITLFPGEERNCRQRIAVKNAGLWSVETPLLYRMCIMLGDDADEGQADGSGERSGHPGNSLADRYYENMALKRDIDEITFGIRKLSLSPHRGLELNGKPLKLRGTCIHHDNGLLGACGFRTSAYRRILLLKEAGINAVRISHHPAGSDILEACDRLGMLVMNELADAWTVCKNPYDYALHFEREWEDAVQRMVESSRNHPSVILYSLGNEIIECGNPKGAQTAWKLNEKIKALDSDRYTILCLNVLLCMMDERQPQEEERSKDVNKAMTKGQHVFKTMITSKNAARQVEEAMGCVDIVGYNYGDSRYLIDEREYPNRILCGSETFSEDLAENWSVVMARPKVLGDFNWTGWDYIGETGIGMVEYEPQKQEIPWKLAFCGDFDLIGNRRAQSYYREAVWGREVHPWILVQEPHNYGRKAERTPWSFFDGLPSWDFPGDDGKLTAVQVYSSGEEVELFLNGKSMGRQYAGERAGFTAEFAVRYEPGELCAVAYRSGKECGRWTIQSGEGETSLLIEKEERMESPENISYYRIMNVYENGVIDIHTPVCVQIQVENGELLGFGSANPKSTEAFDGTRCELFQGMAMAVVRGKEVSISADACACSPCGI